MIVEDSRPFLSLAGGVRRGPEPLGTPTVSAAAHASFGPPGGNRMQALRSQTPLSQNEMGETQRYHVRVIVQ